MLNNINKKNTFRTDIVELRGDVEAKWRPSSMFLLFVKQEKIRKEKQKIYLIKIKPKRKQSGHLCVINEN